jgi:hypothetical protein
MRNPNTPQSAASLIFESVMAILYIAIAYVFAFTTIFNRAIADENLRRMFAIILGLYGIYRIYRVIYRIVRRNKWNDRRRM